MIREYIRINGGVFRFSSQTKWAYISCTTMTSLQIMIRIYTRRPINGPQIDGGSNQLIDCVVQRQFQSKLMQCADAKIGYDLDKAKQR